VHVHAPVHAPRYTCNKHIHAKRKTVYAKKDHHVAVTADVAAEAEAEAAVWVEVVRTREVEFFMKYQLQT